MRRRYSVFLLILAALFALSFGQREYGFAALVIVSANLC